MEGLLDRKCVKCSEIKTADRFYNNGSGICRDCKSEWQKAYEQSLDPEVRRERQWARNIWKKYRMRPADYEAFVAGGCEVCGTHDKLNIDHDHSCCPTEVTCGKCIRGVLCSNHNRGEGYFKSVDEITGLLAYRLKFEKEAANV